MTAGTSAPALANAQAKTKTSKAEPFFQLDAKYSVNEGAELAELVRDGHGLLRSALGVVGLMDITDDALFAVLHLLQQAESVIGLAGNMLGQAQQADKTGGAA